MNSNRLLPWLALAAVADWLITRTLTRAAIFMPKSPLMIAGYQALTLIGQVASTAASLLALGAVIWIAWQSIRTQRQVGLPFVLFSLVLLNGVFLFTPPQGWWTVICQLLLLIAIAWIGIGAVHENFDDSIFHLLAHLIPVLALIASGLYQLIPALSAALRLPGPPPLTTLFFNAGELFAVLSPIGLWFAYARKGNGLSFSKSWSAWLWAALPALLFSTLYLANPSIMAMMAIWSTGLTLYLPWPIYAVSLWLAGVTVIVCLPAGRPGRRGEAVGWVILLLAAGGYAPQLSAQAFLGLVALWILNTPRKDFLNHKDHGEHRDFEYVFPVVSVVNFWL